MGLGVDGPPSYENREALVSRVAESVRRSGQMVATVDRLTDQQLADLRWAVQIAGRALRTPLRARALPCAGSSQIRILIEPVEQETVRAVAS